MEASVQLVGQAYYTTTILWPFVLDYPGEPVSEETFTHSPYPEYQSSFISFLHLLRSIASFLFSLHA